MESLSFAVLDSRIRQLPEGPMGILNDPAWMVRLNVLGAAGAIAGILPSLLIRFVPPEIWMVWLARVGVIVTFAAWAPAILRGGYLLLRELIHHRSAWIAQFDHDRPLFAEVKRWLSDYPSEVLQDHLQFAQQSQLRLTGKLGLLIGGVDKLGVLPAALAVFIALRGWKDLLALPGWLAMFGIFLVLLWLIGWIAASMRLRLQLYELLLTDALKLK